MASFDAQSQAQILRPTYEDLDRDFGMIIPRTVTYRYGRAVLTTPGGSILFIANPASYQYRRSLAILRISTGLRERILTFLGI